MGDTLLPILIIVAIVAFIGIIGLGIMKNWR